MENAPALLKDVTHLLISIAPQDGGDVVHQLHRDDILAMTNLRWLGYLSTTSVYGDRGGDQVTEDTPPAPTTLRGEQRLKAEQDWLDLYQNHDSPVHIFRLASIYGPGRGQHMRLRQGSQQKIIKAGQYFQRIHVADIAQILMASLQSPNPGRIYNVVDDLPAAPEEVIDFITDQMNLPRLPDIPFEDADISPLMRSFFSENKRVKNERIKNELGITLRYPSYREGFRALINKNT